jgi:hypothetical protein
VDDLRDDVTLRFMLEADVEWADAEALTGCGHDSRVLYCSSALRDDNRCNYA